MLCSKCHHQVKPVVAFDIDGTLGDYHSHFLKFAVDWLGPRKLARFMAPPASYRGEEPHREWFCRTFDVDETTFRQIKLAYRQGGLKRTMPMHHNARAAIETLRRSNDCEIWLTTTRPWERFDRVDPDTRDWLDRNYIHFDALIYDEDKMPVLREQAGDRVCFVLDDLNEVLEEADLFWPGSAVKYKTIWNSAQPRWRVAVGDLADAAKMAHAHVRSWYIEHNFDELPEVQ